MEICSFFAFYEIIVVWLQSDMKDTLVTWNLSFSFPIGVDSKYISEKCIVFFMIFLFCYLHYILSVMLSRQRVFHHIALIQGKLFPEIQFQKS